MQGMTGLPGFAGCVQDKEIEIAVTPLKWTCNAQANGAHMCLAPGAALKRKILQAYITIADISHRCKQRTTVAALYDFSINLVNTIFNAVMSSTKSSLNASCSIFPVAESGKPFWGFNEQKDYFRHGHGSITACAFKTLMAFCDQGILMQHHSPPLETAGQ